MPRWSESQSGVGSFAHGMESYIGDLAELAAADSDLAAIG